MFNTTALRLSPFVTLLLFCAFVGGLALDKLEPLWGQLTFSVVAWGTFTGLWWQGTRQRQRIMLWCLVYATVGEVFFSLFWGLYTYRLGNIPPFVPPGHVLLFLLGVNLAAHVPRWLIWLVPLVGAPIFIWGFYQGFNQLDLLLYGFFLACLATRGDNQLYVTMFLLALSLELYGTALQVWTWHPIMPYWGLTASNPPYASGALYCLLDFLVLISMSSLRGTEVCKM